MEIGTEQVFIVNSTDLNQEPSSSPLQRVFEMPEAPEVVETSIPTLPQSSMCSSSRSHMCRLCATVTEMVVPIFEGEGLQHDLANKIHQHLPIQVSQHDLLPVVMCFQCTSTLLAWHELVMCSVQADSVMREHLNYHNNAPQQQQQTNLKANQNEDDKCKAPAARRLRSRTVPPASIGSAANEGATKTVAPDITGERSPSAINERGTREIATSAIASLNKNGASPAPSPSESPAPVRPAIALSSAPRDARTPSPRRSSILEQTTRPPPDVIPKKLESKPENENSLDSAEELTNANEERSPEPTKESGPRASSPRDSSEFSERSDAENEFDVVPALIFRALEMSRDAGARAGCGKPSGSLRARPEHRKRHAARSFLCDACGKTFASARDLSTHARAHGTARPFACRACGAAYTSRAARYIHEQTHAPARRPHACGTCGRAFRWRTALARHVARHAAPALACATCGRAFAVRTDLLRHERAHAPGQHPCPLCCASFRQKRYLKVHVDNKHREPRHEPAASAPKTSKKRKKSVAERTASHEESSLASLPPKSPEGGGES